MSDHQSPNALLNSIIGEGTRFNGEFDLNGLLRIDGDFTGTIRTSGQIIVGLNGRAACNIYADSVVIGGMVRGNVFTSDKVIILSTGMLLGNIQTPRLIVEEGVIFNGNCKITATVSETTAREIHQTGSVGKQIPVTQTVEKSRILETPRTLERTPSRTAESGLAAADTSSRQAYPRQGSSRDEYSESHGRSQNGEDEGSSENDQQESLTSKN